MFCRNIFSSIQDKIVSLNLRNRQSFMGQWTYNNMVIGEEHEIVKIWACNSKKLGVVKLINLKK